jgi:hypothetical protein
MWLAITRPARRLRYVRGSLKRRPLTMTKFIEDLRSRLINEDEDGHGYAWGGGGLLVVLLIVVLLILIF